MSKVTDAPTLVFVLVIVVSLFLILFFVFERIGEFKQNERLDSIDSAVVTQAEDMGIFGRHFEEKIGNLSHRVDVLTDKMSDIISIVSGVNQGQEVLGGRIDSLTNSFSTRLSRVEKNLGVIGAMKKNLSRLSSNVDSLLKKDVSALPVAADTTTPATLSLSFSPEERGEIFPFSKEKPRSPKGTYPVSITNESPVKVKIFVEQEGLSEMTKEIMSWEGGEIHLYPRHTLIRVIWHNTDEREILISPEEIRQRIGLRLRLRSSSK